jgi:hypothetical protein
VPNIIVSLSAAKDLAPAAESMVAPPGPWHLVVAHGNAAILIAVTALGVMLGRHIENGRGPVAYAATQFTLAILVALVPDSYAHTAIGPGLDRLIGILVGSALMEPVLVAWHIVAPWPATVPAEERSR